MDVVEVTDLGSSNGVVVGDEQVDRAILRVGAWELLFQDDVPDAVAISEAVALAAQLSTDDSPEFVNGLLGRLQQVKPTLLA